MGSNAPPMLRDGARSGMSMPSQKERASVHKSGRTDRVRRPGHPMPAMADVEHVLVLQGRRQRGDVVPTRLILVQGWKVWGDDV